MQFRKLYSQTAAKKLSIEDAAKLLSIHERTFRRWVTSYKEEGEIALQDKRLGCIAHNAAPTDEVIELLNLYETRYRNFNVAHFYDKCCDEPCGQRSYT